MLLANWTLGAIFTLSGILLPSSHQKVGGGNRRKLDYYDIRESSYAKVGRRTCGILKLQSLNNQIVVLLAWPRQSELLVTEDKNTDKSKEDSYDVVTTLVLEVEKLAKLALQ